MSQWVRGLHQGTNWICKSLMVGGQTQYPVGVASVPPSISNDNHSNNVLWSYGSTRKRIHAETRALSCLPQKGDKSHTCSKEFKAISVQQEGPQTSKHGWLLGGTQLMV